MPVQNTICLGNKVRWDYGYGPHEPIINADGSFLLPIDPRHCGSGFVVKLCKYCGGIYAEEESK